MTPSPRHQLPAAVKPSRPSSPVHATSGRQLRLSVEVPQPPPDTVPLPPSPHPAPSPQPLPPEINEPPMPGHEPVIDPLVPSARH